MKEWAEKNNPLVLDEFGDNYGPSFLSLSPNLEEGFELGKLYWDDDGIDDIVTQKSRPFWTKVDAPELCEDYEDYDVKVCQPDVLLDVAEVYKKKIVKYFKNMREEIINPQASSEDKLKYCVNEINQKITQWGYFSTASFQKDVGNKYAVTHSWLYEYEIFNLIALYKFVDWNNTTLLYLGY